MRKLFFIIIMTLYATSSWATFHYTHTVSGEVTGGALPSAPELVYGSDTIVYGGDTVVY